MPMVPRTDTVVFEAARPEPRGIRWPPSNIAPLPFKTAQPESRLADRARRSRRSRAVALVLIVDDSAHAREMYSEYLRYAGFRVATAADGSQAIQYATTVRPDVIIMDLAMPNMSGVTATQWLKSHPRTRSIPIMILTGYPYEAIEQGALEGGAVRLLTKPCLPETLEAEVRSVLGLAPGGR
jgi:two-component system, cell cycle response regulator DivK